MENVRQLKEKIKELEDENERLHEELEKESLLHAKHNKSGRATIERYRDALKAIKKVSQFGRGGNIITGSEYYEACWLDCVEIANKALED